MLQGTSSGWIMDPDTLQPLATGPVSVSPVGRASSVSPPTPCLPRLHARPSPGGGEAKRAAAATCTALCVRALQALVRSLEILRNLTSYAAQGVDCETFYTAFILGQCAIALTTDDIPRLAMRWNSIPGVPMRRPFSLSDMVVAPLPGSSVVLDRASGALGCAGRVQGAGRAQASPPHIICLPEMAPPDEKLSTHHPWTAQARAVPRSPSLATCLRAACCAGELVNCTAATCPLASRESPTIEPHDGQSRLINRAHFSGFTGMLGMVSRSAMPDHQRGLYRFFSFLASPAVSLQVRRRTLDESQRVVVAPGCASPGRPRLQPAAAPQLCKRPPCRVHAGAPTGVRAAHPGRVLGGAVPQQAPGRGPGQPGCVAGGGLRPGHHAHVQRRDAAYARLGQRRLGPAPQQRHPHPVCDGPGLCWVGAGHTI